jgi:hypothetical protein
LFFLRIATRARTFLARRGFWCELVWQHARAAEELVAGLFANNA